MAQESKKVILTGFMGVGKSTIARHLSKLLDAPHIDLDELIERQEKRKIPQIIKKNGIKYFRRAETKYLTKALSGKANIISLGGGAWITEENRKVISENNCTSIWLESTFEHCWRNIRLSKKDRPLIKTKAQAKKLFEERSKIYCLAEWHFVINPGHNSFEAAKQIYNEVFCD